MAHTRSFITRERAQSRAYSQAVITEGGRVVWLAGQVALADAAGRSLAGDFEGQVRLAYRLALGREPSDEERGRAVKVVKEHGLRPLCWALFNSSEFVYYR